MDFILLEIQKKFLRLINNRTKVFCLILRNFCIFNRTYPNLDFEIKIVEIRWKLSEIYYFEVKHTTFYISNFFADSWVVNLLIVWKAEQWFEWYL